MLAFDEEPDYKALRKMFATLISRNRWDHGEKDFDWFVKRSELIY